MKHMVDLHEADEQILDHLRDGARTQAYLVDEMDWSRQHVHQRLQILSAAGYITNIHEPSALYELIEDPRETGGNTPNTEDIENVDDLTNTENESTG